MGDGMNPALFDRPFFEVTLPLMVTFVVTVWSATWISNKRLEEMSKRLEERLQDTNKRLDDRFLEVIKRLDKIEARLDRSESDHGTRLTKLEERTWR
jgi:tetrahydromethanopterin S-methyltransferase subunit G